MVECGRKCPVLRKREGKRCYLNELVARRVTAEMIEGGRMQVDWRKRREAECPQCS